MLSFSTTTNATTTAPIERMRITSAGNVWVGNDSNTYLEIANGGSTDVKSGIKWMVGSGRTYYGAVDLATPSASNSYLSFSTMNSGTVAERLKLSSGGNLSFSTADAGIIFNKTSALNNQTLNDYEYGTWTPTCYQSTTLLSSPTAARGYYIKIGRLLYLSFYWYKASGAPSVSGGFQIQGLPFSITADTTMAAVNGYATLNGAGLTNKSWWQGNGSTYLDFYYSGAAQTWSSGYLEFSGAGTFYV
jgi:hypothetical protein